MSCIISQQQIVEELISTERSYVKDLSEVCEVYLPCFGILQNITKDEVNMVFNNIQSILDLSRKLLVDLEASDGQLSKIAESFLNRASDFNQYTNYCTRYHRANEKLFDVRQKNPVAATILLDVQRSLGHPLPLSSYLHKPVQRILKYHLILKNLLKCVDDKDDAKACLQEAYKSMAGCAEEINNSKRLVDMDVNTRELHELLLTLRENSHFGTLVREGEMTVEIGNRFPSTRNTMFIYLFKNVLVLCHKVNGCFALHTILRCSELVVIEDGGRRDVDFIVTPFNAPSQSLTIQAKSLAQKLDWCIQLHKLTDHNIPDKAKKLLLAANESEKEAAKESFSRSSKKRATHTASSPTSIGRSVKSRIRTGVSGILTKSQSTINLRRSSSSTSGGSSCLYKNYDSAFDSTSLKSDLSSSSDQLSSLSSSSNSANCRVTSPQNCYDDMSPRAACLQQELTKGEISNWHHQLATRINSFPSSDDAGDFQTRVRKAKSCEELTTPTEQLTKVTMFSRNRSLSVQDHNTSSRAGKPWLKRNLLDTKKQFIQKISQWRRRAYRSRNKELLSQEKFPLSDTGDIDCRVSSSNHCSQIMEGNHHYEQGTLSAHSRDMISSDYESSEDLASLKETEQDDDTFELNIADNFSESLLETFNSVLQVKSN